MGKAKKGNVESKYILTEREFNYLKILNVSLQYNVFKDKAISGFLYYICNSRFGYKEDQNLVFEIDLDDDKKELTIKEIPTEEIQKAIVQEEQSHQE